MINERVDYKIEMKSACRRKEKTSYLQVDRLPSAISALNVRRIRRELQPVFRLNRKKIHRWVMHSLIRWDLRTWCMGKRFARACSSTSNTNEQKTDGHTAKKNALEKQNRGKLKVIFSTDTQLPDSCCFFFIVSALQETHLPTDVGRSFYVVVLCLFLSLYTGVARSVLTDRTNFRWNTSRCFRFSTYLFESRWQALDLHFECFFPGSSLQCQVFCKMQAESNQTTKHVLRVKIERKIRAVASLEYYYIDSEHTHTQTWRPN